MTEVTEKHFEDIKTEKPRVKLDDWFRIGSSLHGKVYGHPNFEDGTNVYTSYIVTEPPKFETFAHVETYNTIYILGDPA